MGRGRVGGRRCGGGGASGSKRPRRVEEGEVEEEEEEEVEEAGAGQGAEDGEDYCFICKDGGELRVCDFRSCHKAYHPGCVGKDADFLNSDEEFICKWHTCYSCERRTRYYCFCCPEYSYCKYCVKQADFVPIIRKTKGLCRSCLRMAIMIERNVNVDSDGERVDFSDRETYEFLFKDYWEIIKEKEGLTLDNLEEAYTFLERGPDRKRDSDLEKLPDEEPDFDDDFMGHSDNDDDDPSCPTDLSGTSKKLKRFMKERKSKKIVYKGWGSKELIGFLSSIGKDTSKSLDQFGAAEVVKEYIRQKGLLQKDKKKTVICDDKLQSLFRKTKLKYNRVYSLLEKHIAENLSSEDEILSSSEDNDDSVMKKARTMSYEPNTLKRTSEINRGRFAALVPDNIKLIYLKRSLVVDLLKEPETFKSKVIGCFVRIRNNLREYSYNMPKKLYQLGLVEGIRKASEEYKIGDLSTDVLLYISDISEVKISTLSDEDFEEEECEDLRLLVQKECSKRLTVNEGDLEEKAISMRKDIVSHRISKELKRLEKLIEMAHDKGWKKQLSEPSERQCLLEEFLQVIPDMEDSEDFVFQVMAQDKSIQKNTVAFQGEGTSGERTVSLKSCSGEESKRRHCFAMGGGRSGFSAGTNAGRACPKSYSEDDSKGTYWEALSSERRCEGIDGEGVLSLKSSYEAKSKATEAKADSDTTGVQVHKQSTEVIKANSVDDTPGTCLEKQCAEANDSRMTTRVIVIEDEEDSHLSEEGGQRTVADLDANAGRDTDPVQHETESITASNPVKLKSRRERGRWYYMDPQGVEQGPFTLELLCQWWNRGLLPQDFKVWRKDESAVLLRDVLQVAGGAS
ncbi:hypothetical protein ACP4OV_012862 [Aristida adscensionis]